MFLFQHFRLWITAKVYIEPLILWHLITSTCNRAHWAAVAPTCLIEDPQWLVSNHGSDSKKILPKFSDRRFSRLSEQGQYFPPKWEKTLAIVSPEIKRANKRGSKYSNLLNTEHLNTGFLVRYSGAIWILDHLQTGQLSTIWIPD